MTECDVQAEKHWIELGGETNKGYLGIPDRFVIREDYEEFQ